MMVLTPRVREESVHLRCAVRADMWWHEASFETKCCFFDASTWKGHCGLSLCVVAISWSRELLALGREWRTLPKEVTMSKHRPVTCTLATSGLRAQDVTSVEHVDHCCTLDVF